MPQHEYRTEDGVIVRTGDRAYNYYDMKPGVIGEDASGGDSESGFAGWFTFHHDAGGTALLNGQRICTLAFAQRRGFKDA